MSTRISDDSIAASAIEASRCVAREVTVLNPYGVHIRPAAKLTELAQKFQSSLHLVVDGNTYGAGAILDVLATNLRYGKRFTLVAEGADAGDAAVALAEFIERLAYDQSEAQQVTPGRKRNVLPREYLATAEPLRRAA